MGEEQLRPAACAAAHEMNCPRLEAGSEQLAAVGFGEIEVQAGADIRVAGRPLRQKQHRVARANGVGVVDLAEEFAA